MLDGSIKKLDESASEEDFECLGEMLQDVPIKAREDGLFNSLPLSEECVMSLEEFNGSYGWPEYEKLDSEGIVSNA